MADLKDTLDALHTALAEEFLARVRSGEATPSDLNAARQMLKDNGITQTPTQNGPIENLHEALPFTTSDDFDSTSPPTGRKH